MFATLAAPYGGANAPGGMAPGAMAPGRTGTVKSWNGSRGYGFITAAGVPGDVMFLRSELPVEAKEVRGNFLEGKMVNFELAPGNNGKSQAAKIEIITKEGDFLAGRIKSFSDRHGYGFINSTQIPGRDVRFNRQDLDAIMPGVDLSDQLVIFQTQTTPDGKLRVSKVMFQSNKIAQHLKMMAFGKGMFGGGGMMGMMGGNGFGGKGFGGGKGGYGDFGGKGGYGNFGRPNVSVTSTGQRANGVVKSYNAARGFGFITCQGSPADVFFMRSDLPEASRSSNVQGCSVNFELMRTSDGKLRAANMNTF